MLRIFPKIAYDLTGDKKFVTDIFRRVAILEGQESNLSLFRPYLIQDGESPQEAAKGLYNDEGKDWIIFVTNNIVNPYTDWCMSTPDLDAYVLNKYDNPDGVHHYVHPDGYWADSGTPVSNYDYESQLNEARRSILVLRPDFVNRFVEQFRLLARA